MTKPSVKTLLGSKNKEVFTTPYIPSIYIERNFDSIEELKEAMEIHGFFIQNKRKTPKIEVFKITNLFYENNNIMVELDNGISGIHSLDSLEDIYGFLDETHSYA